MWMMIFGCQGSSHREKDLAAFKRFPITAAHHHLDKPDAPAETWILLRWEALRLRWPRRHKHAFVPGAGMLTGCHWLSRTLLMEQRLMSL